MVLLLVALALTAPATIGASGAARQSPEAAEAPVLEIAAAGTTEGHVRLVWRPAGGDEELAVHFELEEARAGDFEDTLLRYAGPARATFVSGLEEGAHHFRLRQRPADDEAAWSAWSAPLVVEITPHSMKLAWALFGTGGALFAAVVGFLTVMAARTRAEDGLELEDRSEELEAA